MTTTTERPLCPTHVPTQLIKVPAQRASAREARLAPAHRCCPVQPRDLGPDALVLGDLCDYLAVGRYCHADASTVAIDCDGRERTLCADHAARFFPIAVS